ncbi:hypothetical protein [Dyadobacter sp. CY356]|uniref:hypothetical protein n=1 Tax=Dyadobacter sp. CY356 TaxID=2906442 RepID=UPI001F1A1A5E|nr:hypothetical protein [Dyadobacter sp. CY356]MCF0055527.1 hypothetical protein [Dyadobacter sp. CY356]
MKESLEAARNIHQIIIFVCAVVAVFAFSLKTELNKYDVARTSLQEINLAIADVNADRVKRIENAARQGGHKRFKMFVDNSSYRNLKLWEIRELLTQNWERLDSIDLVYDGGDNYNVHSTNVFSAAGFPVEAIPSNGAWKAERDYYYGSDYIRAFKLRGFFQGDGSVDSLFRDIQPVWFDINNSSIETAKQLLSDLSVIDKKKDKADVDVSGLKVTGDLIYIIGPVILLLLTSYLIALTLHLKSIIKLKEEAEVANSFPWLALFPNLWSKALSFISLFILPYSVSALTIFRTQLQGNLTIKMLGIYLLAFIVLGCVLIYQLRLVRSKIKTLI